MLSQFLFFIVQLREIIELDLLFSDGEMWNVFFQSVVSTLCLKLGDLCKIPNKKWFIIFSNIKNSMHIIVGNLNISAA